MEMLPEYLLAAALFKFRKKAKTSVIAVAVKDRNWCAELELADLKCSNEKLLKKEMVGVFSSCRLTI